MKDIVIHIVSFCRESAIDNFYWGGFYPNKREETRNNIFFKSLLGEILIKRLVSKGYRFV